MTLARGLREHEAGHPRPPRRELIRAADDAIVLPYGFTFCVSDWQQGSLPDLWQRDAFPLQMGALADGTPYYSVLRCAAEEMERLMDEGREFDVVIDLAAADGPDDDRPVPPTVASAGYARVHDVLPRARLARYDYLWAIRGRYYVMLAALVAFLVFYRSYRIVRWWRRRAKRTPTEE